MELIEWQVPANFNLFLFGDLHIGSTMYSKDGINKLVDMMLSVYKEVKPKNNFGLCHGDVIEGIMIDDPRFDPLVHKDFVTDQEDTVVDTLWPVRDKLVTILDGNHPRKLWRFGDITKRISSRLGVKYGTWSCRVSYLDHKHKLVFKHFATHGRKAISSTADDPMRRLVNMKLILKRHLRDLSGDCLLRSKGHTHRLFRIKPLKDLYLVDDGKKIKQAYTLAAPVELPIHPDRCWYVNTGSFLRLYSELGVSGYAEMAEYAPLEIGFAVVVVRNRQIRDVDLITV